VARDPRLAQRHHGLNSTAGDIETARLYGLTLRVFRLLPCPDKGSEHGSDAGLTAGAIRLEPDQHVGVEAEMKAALGAWDARHNGLLPEVAEVGQRPIISLGLLLNFLSGQSVNPGPIGFGNKL
jgi:hypothetical protein